MADLISVTKSNVGFFSGLYKSKKFSLAAAWTTVSFAVPEVIPIWVGAAVAAVYILGQSFVEGMAARTSGAVETEAADPIDLRTKADIEKKL